MPDATSPPLIRSLRTGHWRALDRVAAAAYALPVAIMLLGHARGAAGWLAVPVGVALLPAPIAWRRRRPMLSAATLLAGTAALAVLEPRSAVLGLVPLAAVLYTIAAQCRPRTAAFGLVVALAVAMATALPDFQHNGGAVFFSVLYIVTWLVGYAVGTHRRYTANLLRSEADRAEAQVERARRAVTEQRMRIARELHDVLAHHLSVITVQAGYAGLVLDEQPDRARAALGTIESAGRQTLDELRHLLGVLRTEDPDAPADAADLAPAPGLSDLDRLVTQSAQAGIRVEVAVLGTPRELPQGIDLSAYRIIQEALTNVVKHTEAPSARVRVDYRSEQLVIEVSDPGPSRARTERTETQPIVAGHGLAGMRERAALYDGELEVSRTSGGGFRVVARLPVPAVSESKSESELLTAGQSA